MDDFLVKKKMSEGPLPDPRYLKALKVLSELESAGYKAMLAGGCVRDRLLGVRPSDYDIVTDALPEAVLSTLRSFEHKVIPTGLAHGTVTVLVEHVPIEVTTLRQDVTTDGRRAQVAFGKDFAEDAHRRDFTINALFEDKSQNIYDYVSGQKDLADGILRFVGEPRLRVQEDALRILRFFRFWSRLGLTPAAGTLEAIGPLVSGLSKISQERITSEIFQIFRGRFLDKTLLGLAQTRALTAVDQNLAQGLERFLSEGRSLDSLHLSLPEHAKSLGILILLLLMSTQGRPFSTVSWCERFKTSNQEKKILKKTFDLFAELGNLGSEHPTQLDFISRCQIYELNFNNFFEPLWNTFLANAHPQELQFHAINERLIKLKILSKTYQNLLEKPMPLDGEMIKKHFKGTEGVEIGRLLHVAKFSWYSEKWHTPEEGLSYLEKSYPHTINKK